jgi:acyl-CoA synthetase (AMP-forming)/AMP-acid ligase II
MRGLMMDRPLLISSLIRYAAEYHGDAEIVSRSPDGLHRYTYRDLEARSKRLGRALMRLGIRLGDRVATLAWNGFRHLELYYGVSCIGAVCHTVNPRLFQEQIRYIVNHAADRVLFLDPGFVPLAEQLAPHLPKIEHYVIMTEAAQMPSTKLDNALCYEDLLAAETADLEWPEFDENTASSLCYTSGTTGRPKGVLYSHRSTVLHSLGVAMRDTLDYSMHDVICLIAPMFHANGWACPYAATMVGAKLVLPGQQLDGASLHELFEREKVTFSLAVPTVWLGVLDYMRKSGNKFSTLKRTAIGGTAVPIAMMKAFDELGVNVIHAWGMTETSPLGTVCSLTPRVAALPPEERDRYRAKQGHGIWGVDLKLAGPDGRELPRDGTSSGELLVRGPWVAAGYFNDEEATAAVLADDWFRTGDVSTLDADGYMTIVDRSKDVIKSGGEWISSIDLENAVMGHPDVQEAAVIGVRHAKWDERPLLVVVAREGRRPDKQQLVALLAQKFAKWQLPDDVILVSELPHTATGKVNKLALRETYRDHLVRTA